MQPHEKKINEMKYLKNQQHGFIKAGLNDKLAWIFGIAAQKFHSAETFMPNAIKSFAYVAKNSPYFQTVV